MIHRRVGIRVRNASGFTLLELVIVVAIIGILATVAISSFQRLLRIARGVEGETALVEIKQLQDVFRQDFGAYAQTLGILGYDKTNELGYYGVSMNPGAAGAQLAYEATAAALPGFDLRTWTLTQNRDDSWALVHSEEVDFADLGANAAGNASGNDNGNDRGRGNNRGRRNGSGRGRR